LLSPPLLLVLAIFAALHDRAPTGRERPGLRLEM
jgi:hypothetical protein